MYKGILASDIVIRSEGTQHTFFSGYVLLKMFYRLTLSVECVGFIGFETQTLVQESYKEARCAHLWICVIEAVGFHFGAHTCFGGEGESYVEARSIHFHQFLTLSRYYYSPLNPPVPCIGDACLLLALSV